ncbi:MAG: hypothetical protein J6F30_16955 [Cellulosilyticum sp.]|nr:hypothetical protein [Cellulosilyticum sp.]
MKVTIVRDEQKLKIGKIAFKSRMLVKGILKYEDLKNKRQQNLRTYWIRVNFRDIPKIIIGDFEVKDKPIEEGTIVGPFTYQVREFAKEIAHVYIAKPDSKYNKITTNMIAEEEEHAFIYTEIKNYQTDRQEITRQLIMNMKRWLSDYHAQAVSSNKDRDIDVQLLEKRLMQMKWVLQALDEMIGETRDLYKVANGREIYIMKAQDSYSYAPNKWHGEVAYVSCRKRKR